MAGVLREYRQSRRQRHAIERWEETWSDVGARIRDLAAGIVPEQLESFLDPEDSMERLQARDMSQAYLVIEDLRKVARERLFPAADEADRIAREWKDQFKGSAAVQRERDAEIAHDALLEKLSEGGVSDPGEYAELVQRKQQIEEKIGEIKRQHSELERVSREARAILSELSGSMPNCLEGGRNFWRKFCVAIRISRLRSSRRELPNRKSNENSGKCSIVRKEDSTGT